MDSNIFLIKWYGPFKTKESEKQWEKEQMEKDQSFKCSLYLLHGKLKYAKAKEHYYCGISTRKIYERLRDREHHIEEIEDRLNSIYVGNISNVKNPTREQILLAEKIITSVLMWELGGERLLNATNFKLPNKEVYIINEWWKPDCSSPWKRQPSNAPSHIVPDVLDYHYNSCYDYCLYGCKKLKKLIG